MNAFGTNLRQRIKEQPVYRLAEQVIFRVLEQLLSRGVHQGNVTVESSRDQTTANGLDDIFVHRLKVLQSSARVF